jgi:hypothetical protein
MRRYNRLENDLLARVMRRLDQGFRAFGIRLARGQWYGPGAATAEWMKQVGAPRRELIEGHDREDGSRARGCVPLAVLTAASAAYVGGWFEIVVHGHLAGVVHEYDITSAYPDQIRRLPCLVHGRWTRWQARSGRRLARLRAGQLRLVRTPPGGIKGSDPYLGAILHRRRDGSILRPQITGGWYWSFELDAARRAGLVRHAKIVEAWTYNPCDCPPPLAGIEGLFEHRLSVGKATPAGKAAKLVMNSVYGKTCQGVGARPFANMVYAGLITAGCRTQLLDAIATHPQRSKAVAMLATDAVFFTAPHPTLGAVDDHDKNAPKLLGGWEHKTHTNLCILKPGVYWDDHARADIAKRKAPKFKGRGINAGAFARHLTDLDEQMHQLAEHLADSNGTAIGWPSVIYTTDFGVTSPKQALKRHRWSDAGKVAGQTVKQSADPRGKRRVPYIDPETGVIRTRPYLHGDQALSWPYVATRIRKAIRDLGAEAGIIDDADGFRTEREDIDTPDGPAGAILYGQLGTGQWA